MTKPVPVRFAPRSSMNAKGASLDEAGGMGRAASVAVSMSSLREAVVGAGGRVATPARARRRADHDVDAAVAGAAGGGVVPGHGLVLAVARRREVNGIEVVLLDQELQHER